MRRSIFLLVFILLICNLSFAQVLRFGVPNLEGYDKERFHWGFSLGINIVDVNLKTRTNYEDPNNISPTNPVVQIYSKVTPAFSVGIIANMRLGEYFDLRFIPSFSIAHNIDLYYQFADSVLVDAGNQRIFSNPILSQIKGDYIILPLFIKFKSSRMHNVRLYVIGGGQVCLNMTNNKKNKLHADSYTVKVKNAPVIKPYDVQVKGGLGFDFYTTYFKFSTEFKVAFGVINMLEDPNKTALRTNGSDYLQSPIYKGLQSLKSKTFSITFLIE